VLRTQAIEIFGNVSMPFNTLPFVNNITLHNIFVYSS